MSIQQTVQATSTNKRAEKWASLLKSQSVNGNKRRKALNITIIYNIIIFTASLTHNAVKLEIYFI